MWRGGGVPHLFLSLSRIGKHIRIRSENGRNPQPFYQVCPYCGIEKVSLADHILREHQGFFNTRHFSFYLRHF